MRECIGKAHIRPVDSRVRYRVEFQGGESFGVVGRYVVFQIAEVVIPRRLFRPILERNRRLKVPLAVPR